MRPPVDTITAPPSPAGATWLNAGPQRIDLPRGRPLLVEFWDFCRPNSLRTLPYLQAWHARYAEAGLRVIGIHAPGFAPGTRPEAVAAAVARLGIEYPVMLDTDFAYWQAYQNLGWPARYLWRGDTRLFDYHYGEGAYDETELAILELLDLDPAGHPLVPPRRPEDVPGARLRPQSEDVAGAFSGPYEAGSVWAVLDLDGDVADGGTIRVNGEALAVEHPGAYELVVHPVSTRAELSLELDPDGPVSCLATCFEPGLDPAAA